MDIIGVDDTSWMINENKDYIENGGMSMVDVNNNNLINKIVIKHLEDLILELDLIAKKYLGDNFSFSSLGIETKNYSTSFDILTTNVKYTVFTKEFIKGTTDKYINVNCKNIDNIKEFTELLLKDLLFDK